MKYMRTAGYIWADYKTNTQIATELKITPVLDKLLEYKRNWIQHVNRISCNRLPRVMKCYSPIGRRNHDRPLKRLLDTWDRNGSTSDPTPWQMYDDDDDVGGGLTYCSRSKPLLVFIFQINVFPTYGCDFPRVNCQYMGVWCSVSIVSLHITLWRNQLMMDGGSLYCELRPPPQLNSEVI